MDPVEMLMPLVSAVYIRVSIISPTHLTHEKGLFFRAATIIRTYSRQVCQGVLW